MLGSSRRKYTTPTLVTLGCVKAMTATGTSGPSESNAGGAGCTGDITRKPCGSERALKENIVEVGKHPLGIGLYLFDYKPEYQDAWGHGRQFGVMADEVQAVMPEAIVWHDDGYRMVDYAMLGISTTLNADARA